MIVAALIAFAISAFAFVSACVLGYGLYSNVVVDQDKRDEVASSFWFCLISSFVTALVGGWLW